MAINVNLNDGNAIVGGSFSEALVFVKSLPGRRWDPASKSWTVPMSSAEFARRCALPLDLPNGSHQTQYGTRYDSAEWSAKQEIRQSAAEIAAKYRPAHEALSAELRARLAALEPREDVLAYVYVCFTKIGLERAVEAKKLGFSSPERAVAFRAVDAWWRAEVSKLFNAEGEERGNAEDRIVERWGLDPQA